MSTPLSVLYEKMNPKSVARARGAIEGQARIKDVEELCTWDARGWDRKNLNSLRNVGPLTIQAIQEGLSALGLSLGAVGPVTKPDFSTLPATALTTRDAFAIAALCGTLDKLLNAHIQRARQILEGAETSPQDEVGFAEGAANMAYGIADAMLKARTS